MGQNHLATPSTAILKHRPGSWQVKQQGPDDPAPAGIDGGDYLKEMRAVSTKAAP